MPDLVAKVRVDGGGVSQGLNQASTAVKKFGNEIKGTIAGAFGGAALVSVVRRTLQDIDQIQDVSEEFEMPTEQVQALENAAKRAMDSFQDLHGIMSKIKDIQFDALRGDNKKAMSIFEQYGISRDQLNLMRNTGDVTKVIATMKDSDINALLGKSAGKFIKYKSTFTNLDQLTNDGLKNGSIRPTDELNQMVNDTANIQADIGVIWRSIVYKFLQVIGIFINLFQAINAVIKSSPFLSGVFKVLFLPITGQLAALDAIYKFTKSPKPAGPSKAIGSKEPLVSNLSKGRSSYSDSMLSVGNFLGQNASINMDVATSILSEAKITNRKLDRLIEVVEAKYEPPLDQTSGFIL